MSPAIPLPPLPPELAASTVRAWLEKGTRRVYGGLCETDLVGVEQGRGGAAGGRRPQAEMAPCGCSGDPASGGAGQQPCPDEERLGDGLDRLGLLGHRDRQRGQPYRAAAEPTEQRVEDRPVEPVEAELVDLVDLQRGARDLP